MRWLLKRLVRLLQEDGRLPRTMKVTARELLKDKSMTFGVDEKIRFQKESRQCKINPSLFGDVKNMSVHLEVNENAEKIANFISQYS